MRANIMKTVPPMKTLTAYLDILFCSCCLIQTMFMVCFMQITINLFSSQNTVKRCMHEQKMKLKIFHSYCKYFSTPYLIALVIADQLFKNLLLGLCLWSVLFYHCSMSLMWFRIHLMLIYKNNQKGLYAWQFWCGYVSASLHTLPNMGTSKMILTQVETSPAMFECAVVTLDYLPGDTGLGKYLGNCRTSKQ